jgi:hypothetical protein
MAISNAVTLANLSAGDTLTVDNQNDRVGIASTNPTATLDVGGVIKAEGLSIGNTSPSSGSINLDGSISVGGSVTASEFYGDGSNLDGVASAGLGTALADDGFLGVVYYTNEQLIVPTTTTVTVPDTSNVAYTQYQDIVLEDGVDLIISDGDDFIPDILGIGTDVQQPGPLSGDGGRIRAGSITDKSGTGAPTFPNGIIVTGIITATTVNSNLSGNLSVTGNISGGSSVTATSFHGDGSGLSGVSDNTSTTKLTWLFGGG